MNSKDIFELHKRLRDEMHKDWDRVLPFNEEFTDRWEKAKFLEFGEGSSIYDSSIVMGKVKVGRNVWIGPYTLLDGTGGLIVGDFCSISAGTHIYTHETVLYCLTSGQVPRTIDSVNIGNNCYIGPMCIISKGVKLGNYCVVGANSFVNQSFESNTIIAGNPAKIIGKIVVKENEELILEYL